MTTLTLDIRRGEDGQGETWLREVRLATFDATTLITERDLNPDAGAIRAQGAAIWTALGGDALRGHLPPPAPDGLLALRIHDEALHAIPWELAWRGDHDDDFVALDYLMVRVVPDASHPAPPAPDQPWHLAVQGSNPLIHERLDPTTGQREVHYERPLHVVRELETLRRRLVESNPPVPLRWHWLAPTAAALSQFAPGAEPVIYHYTGHGTVQAGRAMLCLDDGTGRMDVKPAASLARYLRGRVRLAFLNACRTADAQEPAANLALALVRGGVPVVVGNRTVVEDDKAAALAATFYAQLAQDSHPTEALWRARLALHDQFATDPVAWSLPLLLMAEGYEWPAIARPAATPPPIPAPPLNLSALQAPREIVGRADELVELASAFVLDGARAVTIRGPGGMGKSALSKALAERLRWHFRDGIYALTLILSGETPLSAARVRTDVAALLGVGGPTFDALPPDQQESALITAVAGRELLLIFDNYETVLQRIGREETLEQKNGKTLEQEETKSSVGTGDAPPSQSEIRNQKSEIPSLLVLLTQHFDVGELDALGYEVAGLAPDEVGGERRDARALALIEVLERRGTLAALLPVLERERPGHPWAAALAMAAQGLPAPEGDERSEGMAVQRLVRRLKEQGGARLLFTTRQSPVGIEDRLYPRASGQQLAGLRREDAARLFRQLTRAHDHRYGPGFPAQVAEQVGDSPLYLELAASRWNSGSETEREFLTGLADALLTARQEGVPENRQQAVANLRLSLGRNPDQRDPACPLARCRGFSRTSL